MDVPSTTPDADLCEVPDPADLPAGTRYRDYPSSRHISLCEDDDTVRYIICGVDGETTVNLIDCIERHPCLNGACTFFDPAPTDPFCVDTDPANDVHTTGEVVGVNEFGDGYSYSDSCYTGTRTRERTCNADGTPDEIGVDCPAGERCTDGICIPTVTCDPTCTDSDPANNPHFRGGVSGGNGFCEPYSSTDGCSDRDETSERTCNADGTYGDSLRVACPTGESCEDGICRSCSTTCSRTAATATEAGFVTQSDCVVQHDICDGSTLVRYACGAGGFAAELDRVTCPGGCADGLCL